MMAKSTSINIPALLPVTCQGNAKALGKSPLDMVRDDIADFLWERTYTRFKLFIGRTGGNVRIA